MILFSITEGQKYAPLLPALERALRFIESHADAEAGKYPIEGDDLFVIIADGELRSADEAKLESHRQYIDIQVVLQGRETFGWAPVSLCTEPCGEFDAERDIIFWDDAPTTYLTAHEGQGVVFFPNDAHAPLVGQGKVRKAIAKLKVY